MPRRSTICKRRWPNSPDDTRVLFALGNTARALGMTQPAEEFYRMVLALEPGRLEALVNLANLLRAEGNFGWRHRASGAGAGAQSGRRRDPG